MNRENTFSILIRLPEEESFYLKEITGRIAQKRGLLTTKNEFHLTLEQTISCSDKLFRVDLNDWLEQQPPIEFRLDQVDQFKNRQGGVIYLTTQDKKCKRRIVDLYQDIDEITQTNDSFERRIFVPHVTLFQHVPFRMINQLKNDFSSTIKPLTFEIDEILVRKKIEGRGWVDYEKIPFGNALSWVN